MLSGGSGSNAGRGGKKGGNSDGRGKGNGKGTGKGNGKGQQGASGLPIIKELKERDEEQDKTSGDLSRQLSKVSVGRSKLPMDSKLRNEWTSMPNAQSSSGKDVINEVGIRSKPVTQTDTSTPTHQGARTIGTPAASSKGRRVPGQTNIEVGNLHKKISDVELLDFFSAKVKGLKSAQVDKNTRKWTSVWGQLDFDNPRHAEDAIAKCNGLQDTLISDGRPLEITWDRGFGAPSPLDSTFPSLTLPSSNQAPNMQPAPNSTQQPPAPFPTSIKIDNINAAWNQFTVTGKLDDALGGIDFDPKPVILLRPPQSTHCSVIIKFQTEEAAQQAYEHILSTKLYGKEELRVRFLAKAPELPDPPVGRVQLDNVCHQWTNQNVKFRVKAAIGDMSVSRSLSLFRIFPLVPQDMVLSTKSFVLQFHSPDAAYQAIPRLNGKTLGGPTLLQATILPLE